MAQDICLEVSDLVAEYGRGQRVVLDGTSFSVPRGKTLVLLGPSGCGKTTALRCVAGLHAPSGGSITIDGQLQFGEGRGRPLAPEKRPIGMVFQSYALWPHMTVLENVEFPLRARAQGRVDATALRAKSQTALAAVGMEEYGQRYPWSLSGGQQQRVAMARAVVGEPALLLLDEPLSNLDARVRRRLRNWLGTTLKRLSMTSILVTHDQSEALALGDEIAVMHDGRIVERGTPAELYRNPSTILGARAVGRANGIAGSVFVAEGSRYTIDSQWGRFDVEHADGRRRHVGEKVTVYFRPEQVRPALGPDSVPQVLIGQVTSRVYLGNSVEYEVSLGEEVLIVDVEPDVDYQGEVGDEFAFTLAPGAGRILAED